MATPVQLASCGDIGSGTPRGHLAAQTSDIRSPGLPRRLSFGTAQLAGNFKSPAAPEAEESRPEAHGWRSVLAYKVRKHGPEAAAGRAADLGDVRAIKKLMEAYPDLDKEELSAHAAAAGHLHVLQAFCEKKPEAPVYPVHCFINAAERGHAKITSWLVRHYTSHFLSTVACTKAAEFNLLLALRALRSLPGIRLEGKLCPWDHDVAEWASLHGNLEMLRFYGRSSTIIILRCAEIAAQAGQVHILVWLKQEYLREFDFDAVCMLAAQQGSLRALETLAQAQPCTLVPRQVAAAAAFQGHLPVVQWLIDHAAQLEQDPCPLHMDDIISTIHLGHHHIAQWLLEQKVCSLSSLAVTALDYLSGPAVSFLAKDHLDIFTALFCAEAVVRAAFLGHVAIVKTVWPASHSRAFLLKIMQATISGSTLAAPTASYMAPDQMESYPKLLLWMAEKLAPFTHDEQLQLNDSAAEVGSLVLLQLAADSPQPSPIDWDARACGPAAACGSLDLLKWMLANPPAGLQWSNHPELCAVSAECSNGRMLLLTFFHRWHVPAHLEDHLEMVEDCRCAFYCYAYSLREHLPRETSLAHLPDTLVTKIACLADIDFSWEFSE